jgi:hypothetical protein
MKRIAMLSAALRCALWGCLILPQGVLAEEGGALPEPAQASCDVLVPPNIEADSGLPSTGYESLLQWLQQWWNNTAGSVQSALDDPGERGLFPSPDGGEEGFDILIRQ